MEYKWLRRSVPGHYGGKNQQRQSCRATGSLAPLEIYRGAQYPTQLKSFTRDTLLASLCWHKLYWTLAEMTIPFTPQPPQF